MIRDFGFSFTKFSEHNLAHFLDGLKLIYGAPDTHSCFALVTFQGLALVHGMNLGFFSFSFTATHFPTAHGADSTIYTKSLPEFF